VRLFNRYFTIYDLVLVAGDLVIVLGVSLAARGTMAWVESARNDWPAAAAHGLAMAIIVLISFYYSGVYEIDQTFAKREMVHRFIAGMGIACVVIAIISYPIPNFGKSVYLSEMIGMGICLGLWRLGFASVIQAAGGHAKVLIIGTGRIGRMVAEQLYLRKTLGMHVVGFISENTGKVALSYGNPKKIEIPIFAPQSLAGLVAGNRVNRILLAGGLSQLSSSHNKQLLAVRAMGVPIEDCHSFYERLVSKIAVADLPPEWIALSKGFRRDGLVLITKRMIDVFVAFLGLILSAPVALLTAIAIKLDSPGPIFYWQERVGQNERPFTLIKFRSMVPNAEKGVGPVWAEENDCRVTGVGAIIRKLRIDEIPQMVNVLKGEMSFVGPRPERPFFVERLKQTIPYYDLRHTVKPGITGWAQISYPYGDSDHDAIEKLQYDLYYIKHMSPIFDVQIIFESVKVILFGSGSR
jgi:sugar transferase (PEP-CTERM system associated)